MCVCVVKRTRVESPPPHTHHIYHGRFVFKVCDDADSDLYIFSISIYTIQLHTRSERRVYRSWSHSKVIYTARQCIFALNKIVIKIWIYQFLWINLTCLRAYARIFFLFTLRVLRAWAIRDSFDWLLSHYYVFTAKPVCCMRWWCCAAGIINI